MADRLVTAMRARELGRRAVVVGDRCAVVGDLSGGPDSLARIVRVEPRTSVLRRSADDTDPTERIVVANADFLVVVMSLADPDPQPRLLDRCLVAAYDGGLSPVLVLTKSDLADPAEMLAAYAELDFPVVVTGPGGEGDDTIRALLADRMSVLFGSSGVGKSTLVNRLVPAALRATGIVNTTTGRGRHTSSSAVALPLPGGGWVVDTPGVRSFGLAHVDPSRVVRAFPDLAPGAENCPGQCGHLDDGCALDAWVQRADAGPAAAARLISLRRVLTSRDGESSR